MSKRKGKPKVKRVSRRRFGLRASDYPRNVSWKFDADYLDKLSDEERAWYAHFMEAHLGADSKAMDEWPVEMRRKAYVEKNAANRDMYGITDAGSLLSMPGELPHEMPDEPERDWSETPLYLSDPDYLALKRRLLDAIDARPRDEVLIANLKRKLETYG